MGAWHRLLPHVFPSLLCVFVIFISYPSFWDALLPHAHTHCMGSSSLGMGCGGYPAHMAPYKPLAWRSAGIQNALLALGRQGYLLLSSS